MRPPFLRASPILLSIAGALSASPALAHIDLLEPEARAHGTSANGDPDPDPNGNSNLKNAPCGQITTGRTDRVTAYAPGETIVVRVREENAHDSYLRVSIDLDGESFPLRAQAPPGPETQQQVEAAEAALGGEGLLLAVREDNDTPGFVHELEVTLPDATCDACTLQVLQFMYDDPAAPYYFQCADLVIAEAGGAADAGGGDPDSGAEPGGAGAGGSGSDEGAGGSESGAGGSGPGSDPVPVEGSGGGDSAGAGGAGSGAPAAAGATGTGAGNGAAGSSARGSDGGGCAASGRGRGSAGPFGLLALAFGLSLARRRSRFDRLPRPRLALGAGGGRAKRAHTACRCETTILPTPAR
jgi:hypothetical protein